MQKIRLVICSAALCLFAAFNAMAAEGRRVVVYEDVVTDVGAPPAALAASSDLWVTLKDLTRATKFVLKPQGVCRDQLCFPVPKARKSAFLSKQGAVTWFNLSEFARLLRQPVAFNTGDAQNATTWYFGARPEVQNSFVDSLIAPNFTLPDINGKMHSLSDFRGKKVLIVTWASW